ncbi:small membrane protein YldA, partial [Escherichia coli]
MAEAFYILIGFLIMAAIIVMAVLYLENHSYDHIVPRHRIHQR